MPSQLRAELKQRRPFELHEEALLSVMRTADVLARRIADALKPFGLTGPQYNVLRILRGAGSEGRTCSEVGERMVTVDPDVTRMLDRLEKRGLIRRARDPEDRRVVRSWITEDGLDLLEQAVPAVDAVNAELTRTISRGALEGLIGTLDVMRARSDEA